MTRTSAARLFAACAAAALALSACGGNDTPADPTTTPEATPSTTEATPTPTEDATDEETSDAEPDLGTDLAALLTDLEFEGAPMVEEDGAELMDFLQSQALYAEQFAEEEEFDPAECRPDPASASGNFDLTTTGETDGAAVISEDNESVIYVGNTSVAAQSVSDVKEWVESCATFTSIYLPDEQESTVTLSAEDVDLEADDVIAYRHTVKDDAGTYESYVVHATKGDVFIAAETMGAEEDRMAEMQRVIGEILNRIG